MSLTFIGTTFPATSQWHVDEVELIDNISQQITKRFPSDQNLFVNTTWFGPQFDNGEYEKFLKFTSEEKFDNLFLLAAVDPVFLNREQIDVLLARSGAKRLFPMGHFDGPYQFNFHSQVLAKYFKKYNDADMLLTTADYVYLCYNRKPRTHRVELVKKILDNNLKSQGILTLGKNDSIYNKTEYDDLYFLLDEQPEDYAGEGNWGFGMDLGIPHDIHSLGNMEFWRKHFLTVVSETEFFPWDNLFVSEKTWKPILGLRPFVVNGQSTVYQWLRDNKFKTFNHWFPIELENIAEYQVHDAIVAAIKYCKDLGPEKLVELYNQMLPDLLHNRQRFYEFSREQSLKINHIFKTNDT